MFTPSAEIRSTSFNQARPLVDIAWKERWPFVASNLIASMMLICAMTIIGLEIASLVISRNSTVGNTSSVGGGVWCGAVFFLAAVFIFVLNCVRNLRDWATTAFVAALTATLLAAVLLGLDAKAVHDGRVGGTLVSSKTKVLTAQLAFVSCELLLGFAVLIIYFVILISVARYIRKQHDILR